MVNNLEMLETSKNIMMERTFYSANGFIFKIEPVYLGEESEFTQDFNYSFIPNKPEEEITDDDRVALLQGFFAKPSEEENTKNLALLIRKSKKQSLLKLIFSLFKKDKTDYENYYKGTLAENLIPWIEKKITVKGKKIKFHELERKYGLQKLEIYGLLLKFMEISNFPTHLPKKK